MMDADLNKELHNARTHQADAPIIMLEPSAIIVTTEEVQTSNSSNNNMKPNGDSTLIGVAVYDNEEKGKAQKKQTFPTRKRVWISSIVGVVLVLATSLYGLLSSRNTTPDDPTPCPSAPPSLRPTPSPLCQSLPSSFACFVDDLQYYSRTELYIYKNDWLTGTIPTSIGLLTQLTALELIFNQGLTGSYPTELGQLTNLSRLVLSANVNMNGTMLPAEIVNLTDLEYLRVDDFSKNISVSFPPDGIEKLSKLTSLSLGSQVFEGSLPTEIGYLTNLEYFRLQTSERYGVTGTIPTELGKLVELSHIDLDDGQLIGTIPTELGLLTKLTYLWLYQPGMEGSIPSELQELKDLKYFGSLVGLTGTVPPEMCDLYIGYTFVPCNTEPPSSDPTVSP